MGGHMMDWDMPFNGFHFGFGGFYMWIFWLILIGGIVYLIVKKSGIDMTSKETPLDIAKRRYANGEITKEEFEEIKRNI